MRAALDTNLLVYAEGFGDTHRVDTTRRVLKQLGNMDAYPVFESNTSAWRGAMDLCVSHQLSSWDALVLNGAAEAGARILLTEDLQPGFSWRGVRIVNPLADRADPLLEQLLA